MKPSDQRKFTFDALEEASKQLAEDPGGSPLWIHFPDQETMKEVVDEMVEAYWEDMRRSQNN